MSLASSAAYTERCLAAFRRSLSAAPAGCFAWATRAALIGAPTEDSDAFPRRVDHMQTTQSRPAQVFEHSANPGTLSSVPAVTGHLMLHPVLTQDIVGRYTLYVCHHHVSPVGGLSPLWLFLYGSRSVRVLFVFTSLSLCIIGAGALCSSRERDCGQEPLELLSQICSSLERWTIPQAATTMLHFR